MTRVSTAAVALTALLLLSTGAQAAPIYDFSDASDGTITDLGASAVLAGGITASAYYFDGSWQASVLVARAEGDDDSGLGVCSEDPTGDPGDCNFGGTGAGDDNELSQLTYTEAILLERPLNTSWANLYVSSLDNNGGDTDLGNENGTLFWGNTNDIASLISGGGSYAFSAPYAPFGGDVFGALALPGGFDPFAKYVLFVPGTGSTTERANNDYLVWGADLRGSRDGDLPPVPEPASLVLLGSGLVALAHKRRRDRRR